jgi:acyl-CoA reductase-like NAD-dependent aldehyde dehydrogenase
MIRLTGLRQAFTPVIAFIFAFHLGLTIILADQAQCHRVSSALEAGTVRHTQHLAAIKLIFLIQIWVNQYNVLYNNVPFGGKKQSGIGRSHHQLMQATAGANSDVFQ